MNEQRVDQDLVRMPAGALAAAQRVLVAEGDPARAADRLRRWGVEAGAALGELLAERVAGGAAGAIEDVEGDAFWERLDAFFRDLGWGGLAHERLHPGVLSLSSEDWFESVSTDAAEPACHFTVGVLGELFRRIAGSDVAVMEVRCRGAGAGECRFLVGSPQALEPVFARMRSGIHYREAVAELA